MKSTLQQIHKNGKDRLEKAGIEEGALDSRILLERAFGISQAVYLRDRQLIQDIPETAFRQYEDWIGRRVKREPLQYILEETEFFGYTFHVSPEVLIPRQDTEVLVEWVLEECSGDQDRVLDLCTGSGCIAISLKLAGKYSYVAAGDISAEALQVAGENARRLGAEVHLYESDLYSAIPKETFDVITANPPYIPECELPGLQPEVSLYEPTLALTAPEKGLALYRPLADGAAAFCHPGTRLYLEMGMEQGEAIEEILLKAGFRDIAIRRDYAGKNRVIRGIWPGEG